MSSFSYSAAWLVWILTLPGVLKTPFVPLEAPRAPVARQTAPAPKAGREFFISWGYNGDNYATSDMHFSQPSLGNNFTLAGVQASDSKAWTDLFSHSLFVPQYNVRFGFFLNTKWGMEVALDHMKWIVRQDQVVPMTGTMNGAAVNAPTLLSTDVIKYKLNNGANPIFFNLVRRIPLKGEHRRTGYMAALVKAGGGFAVPHTENTMFGQPNEKGFQPFHGWNLDAAGAFRAHLYKGLYLELEDKLVYARYFGVKVDQGTAAHSLKANEFSFHFGMAF